MTSHPLRALTSSSGALFGVTNMEPLRFYVDGLGFKMKHRWIPES